MMNFLRYLKWYFVRLWQYAFIRFNSESNVVMCYDEEDKKNVKGKIPILSTDLLELISKKDAISYIPSKVDKLATDIDKLNSTCKKYKIFRKRHDNERDDDLLYLSEWNKAERDGFKLGKLGKVRTITK